jgi:hypothetical protein
MAGINWIKTLMSILIFLVMIYGCREPYEPDIRNFDQEVLVVEGYIEVGGGKTSIKLSRTQPIYTDMPSFPVLMAEVVVFGGQEGSWQLNTEGNGVYSTEDNLPENQSYTLSISLGQTEWYMSEEITPILTPEFDVSFEKNDGDVKVYANTYGNEAAQYFMWQYDETWKYRTPYTSFFEYDEATRSMASLSQDELTYMCWNDDFSRRVILESSSRFENNQIFQKELTQIDSLSEKLGIRYRINVKQYAIDREAFIFWEGIRRNSDDIGDIFSPMPSLVSSNIYHTENPDQPVIGHISAGKSQSRTIYINKSEVDPWRVVIPHYFGCTIDTVATSDYYEYFVQMNYVPINEACDGFPCVGFLATTRGCVDCTLRGGGSLMQPEFWEDE